MTEKYAKSTTLKQKTILYNFIETEFLSFSATSDPLFKNKEGIKFYSENWWILKQGKKNSHCKWPF